MMPEPFDPYYEWLGIPPRFQPPNHYRLLGIELNEENPNVIERAADRQMAHVRTFQTGKHAKESQKLLNELSAARVCLLDPKKKAEYDRTLKEELRAAEPAAVEKEKALDFIPAGVPIRPASVVRSTVRRDRPRPPWHRPRVLAVVAAVGLATLFLFLLSQFARRGTAPPEKPSSGGLDGRGDKSALNKQKKGKNGAILAGDLPKSPPMGSEKLNAVAQLIAIDESVTPPTDPDPGSVWPSCPQDVKSRVTSAEGMIEDQFALCQTMPFEDFVDVARQLRPCGYRPTRIRPFNSTRKLLVAAIWTRDGLPWRMVAGVSASTARQVNESLQAAGFRPTDIAGFRGASDLYVAVWCKPAEVSAESQFLAGTPQGELAAKAQSLRDRGHWPDTLHAFSQLGGANLQSQVWSFAKPTESRDEWEGSLTDCSQRVSEGNVPVDLCLVRAPDGSLRCRGIFQKSSSRQVRVSHGLPPVEHRAACRNLATEGFRPSAVSVIETAEGGPLSAISIWERPEPVQVASKDPPPQSPPTTSPAEAPKKEPAVEPAEPSDPRHPVPDDAAVKAALAKVRETWKEKYASVKEPLPTLRLNLDLLRRASEEKDVKIRYAMLVEARRLATDAGQAHIALRAIAVLGKAYQVDRWASTAETMGKLVGELKSKSDRHVVAEMAFFQGDDAIADGAIASADRLMKLALQVCRGTGDSELAKFVNSRLSELAPLKKMEEKANQASERLKESSDDAEAHLALGKFRCFVQGDWDRGIQNLARSSDAELAQLARDDLAAPADAEPQAKRADAWLAWGNARRDRDAVDRVDKLAALRRARYWFEKAVPRLSGLEAARATKQLADLKATTPRSRSSEAAASDGAGIATVGQIAQLTVHAAPIQCMALARSGRWIVTGSDDDTVRVVDLATHREVEPRIQLAVDVLAIKLSPDDRSVVAALANNTIGQWNSLSRAKLGEMKADARVLDMALFADGRRVLRAKPAADTKNLVASDLATGKEREYNVRGTPICLALSPTARWAAVAQDRRVIAVVELTTGGSIELRGHTQPIRHVAFSPNDPILASCSPREIIIWDLTTFKELRRLQSSDPTSRIAFSPDGGRLLSTAWATQLTLWDVESGAKIQDLPRSDTSNPPATALAYLPDALGAVSAGNDGNIRLWRLPE